MAWGCVGNEKPLAVELAGTRHDPEIRTGATPTGDSEPRFRMAVAAVLSPGVIHKTYSGLADLLSEYLDMPVDLIQRKTYAEVTQLVAQRTVDLAFVCSLPFVLGEREFGMESLAIPVVAGQDTYRSYLIVRDDDPALSIHDLEGRSFAFSDSLSFSGRLVAVYWLDLLGHTAKEFFSSVIYTHSHDNSIRAVARGLVDGAVVDSLVWEKMLETEPDIAKRTRVIRESEAVGAPPFVVHPDLDPGVKAMLQDFLLTIHETPEGRAVLDGMGVDRFIHPQPLAYEIVRMMWDHMEEAAGD